MDAFASKMRHPILYLFYPRRNPSLSYTRQIQGLIGFILFVLVTISAPNPEGALLIPSLGASVVVAVTGILLAIASTDLSRTIEDQVEKAVNRRLQHIAPHHARVIKNNLHPTPTQPNIRLAVVDNQLDQPRNRRVRIDQYNDLPVNQPDVVRGRITDAEIRLYDFPDPDHPPHNVDELYLNQVPYKHLRKDALAMARSLVVDPPVLIDSRMILYKIWQRPGHYRVDKELLRWGCYAIHILVYLSPVWWALWEDLDWQSRLIPVVIHCVVLLAILGCIITHDFGICRTALEDGDIEKYLYRLYKTNEMQPVIEHLPYNRSLYIMHLLNVVANHYKNQV